MIERPTMFCWWRALILCVLGLHLANPLIHTFGNTPVWDPYLARMPEEMWGVLMIAIGSMQAMAILRRWRWVRVLMLWFGGLLWLSIAVSFFVVMPTGQSWILYGALALANFSDFMVLGDLIPHRSRRRSPLGNG